jgi:hypothetical protein
MCRLSERCAFGARATDRRLAPAATWAHQLVILRRLSEKKTRHSRFVSWGGVLLLGDLPGGMRHQRTEGAVPGAVVQGRSRFVKGAGFAAGIHLNFANYSNLQIVYAKTLQICDKGLWSLRRAGYSPA